MSDDEYYDSPYDEFEEMLWDADPAPHLADDLAQHAAHSPVWQDDPVGELEAYHSDWEYYSDDYFDDDPAILRADSIDGTLPQGGKKKDARSARGRKRKIDQVPEAVEGPEVKFLRRTIRGTIWAENTPSVIKLFHHGRQEKVALLVDWRERFQLGQHGLRNPRATLKRDESWANDLSLDDMGLKRVRERRGTQQDTAIESDDAEDDVEYEQTDGVFEQLERLAQENNSSIGDPEDQLDGQDGGSLTNGLHGGTRSHSETEGETTSRQSTKSKPRKTTQRSQALSASRHPEPGGDLDRKRSSGKSQEDEEIVRSSTNVHKNMSDDEASAVKENAQRIMETSKSNGASQRKRKLSSALDESSQSTGSTASSRAKRVASSRLGSDQKGNDSSEAPVAKSRSTRTRKS